MNYYTFLEIMSNYHKMDFYEFFEYARKNYPISLADVELDEKELYKIFEKKVHNDSLF